MYVFILFNYSIYSQKINVTVKDVNNVAIENASIIVWDSNQKENLISYTFTNNVGQAEVQIKIVASYFIEVSCINYTSFLIKVSDVKTLDVVLQSNITILEEIVVKTEKAIQVRKDSTFYDPQKFLNGTEKKVEDLLKKLPGITVNETTGQIKFKGKDIATVKLENDDLFGANYVFGTQHIAVDMVEQVQAIENYSANSLLKGIEDSDKVVLNLKLKKNKSDFSGDLNTESGYEKKILSANESTILGINKDYKLFGFVSQSNFGVDSNNLDPVFEDVNINSRNFNFLAKKNISLYASNSILTPKRTAYNKYFQINNNLIFNLSKQVKIKSNFYFFKDNFDFVDSSATTYNNQVSISNMNMFSNNPIYFRTDLKLIYNLSAKSLIESEFVFKTQTTKAVLSSLQNNTTVLNSELYSQDIVFNSQITFTSKLNDKQALQIQSFFSNNVIPQEFKSFPAINFISESKLTSNIQNSSFSKSSFKGIANYMIGAKNIKNSFFVNVQIEKSPFVSQFEVDTVVINAFNNNLIYGLNLFSMGYFGTFKIGKFKFNSFISFENIKQKVLNIDAVNTALPYIFTASYNVNKHSINFNNDLNYKTPTEDYLFTNNVVTGSNTVRNNLLSLNLIKNNQYSLNYKYDDLLKLVIFKLSFNSSKIYNQYIFNLRANQNFISYTYFQNPTAIESKSINTEIEKSFKRLHLFIKQSLNYSNNNYQNSIDNFEIRNNFEKRFNANTTLLSSFNFPVNFESKFNFTISSYNGNKFTTITQDSFNYLVRVNLKTFDNLIFSISNEYLNTDLNTNNSLSFWDFNFQYKATNLKWLKFSIQGKNLLNVNSYQQLTVNDFSVNTYQSQILSRHFLGTATLNF